MAVDARTGRVLYARNADARRIPASITKVMTLYMLFGEIRRGRYGLSSRLLVSRHAAAQQPSKLGLRAGKTIDVDSAIRIIVTKSANDIAVAVAENIAGSESAFARRMTRKARAMGMTRTIFRNASGLPRPANVTTARDLATLALRIQRDFPRLYKRYFGLRRFRYGRRIFRNHNHLLGRVSGMDGLKTGYTRAAGYNLAASTRRNGKRIVTVVLGARSGRARNAYMARMIEQIFRTKNLARGTRIAALAGMPPGLSRRAARRILVASASRAKPHVRKKKPVVTAVKPRPARKPAAKPSQLAMLAGKVARQPAPAASATRVPLPVRRPKGLGGASAAKPVTAAKAPARSVGKPQDAQALAKAKEPAAASPAPANASGAVAVAVRVGPPAPDTGKEAKKQGAVFAAVRPAPAANPGEDANARRAAAGKTISLAGRKYASLTGGGIPVSPGARALAAAQTGRHETVIAKSNLSFTADQLAIPGAQAPRAANVASVTKSKSGPLKDTKTAKVSATPPSPAASARRGAESALAGYLKSWNIQLGAYPARAGAERRIEEARKSFARHLRGKAAFTMVYRKGAATYYRARFAGFDRASARRACRMMKKKGLACLSLAPKG